VGKKTSVYLSNDLVGRMEASGLPISELVRRGLDAGEPQPAEVALTRLLDGWGERILQRIGVSPGPEPERSPENCNHPRIHGKGVCPDCHEWVASKR
jgi:hypothetical protein